MKIAVFISGTGRNLKNLIEHQDKVGFEIRLVVADREAPGLQYATNAKLPFYIVRPEQRSPAAYSQEMFDLCRNVDYICLAGFLPYLYVYREWKNRILNIHPSLLPAFGGKKMYGMRVHNAVIEHGCQWSGCTVHLVDHLFDHGPILVQKIVPVQKNDTPEILAQRVFEQELIAYPEALSLLQRQKNIKP